MNDFKSNQFVYISLFNISEEDAKHIRRLQALRETGSVNMFTDVRRGLEEVFGKDGEETYQWITDNWEYYMSGQWVDASV